MLIFLETTTFHRFQNDDSTTSINNLENSFRHTVK
uniref:Uncharacterized protein n=1 Tax=Heterorhabditis bacteriophora TaxID=37862 RepID=A0A1I7WHT3_HETBA